MAAPSNAYITQKSNANTTSGTVQHSLAIPNTDATTLKNRFYLDKFFPVQTASGTTFIGGCKVGSLNYQHHNTTRIGALRSRAEDLAEVVYFTDAGLNTMGGVTSTVVGFYVFNLRLNTLFKSSFYSLTTNYGVRGRKRNLANTGWEAWESYNLSSLHGTILSNESKQIINPGFDGMGLDENAFPVLLKGLPFEMQPWIENEEGIFYGTVYSVIPIGKAINFYNNPTTYYMDTDVVGGFTKFYNNENFEVMYRTRLELYIDAYRYWVYDYDEPLGDFGIIGFVDDTPVTSGTPTKYTYSAYSSVSEEMAVDQVTNGYGTGGVIWYETASSTWWADWNSSDGFSNSIPSGWYVAGDMYNGVTEIKYI